MTCWLIGAMVFESYVLRVEWSDSGHHWLLLITFAGVSDSWDGVSISSIHSL